MEDKQLDKMIYDTFNKDIVIPDLINLKVDESLENINNGMLDKTLIEENKKCFKKRLLKIAASFIILITSFSLLLTNRHIMSYASQTINHVFKLLSSGEKFNKYDNINENYNKYSNKVMAQASDNGATVTITDVFTDSYTLKIGYFVRGKNVGELIQGGCHWMSDCDDIFIVDDEKIKVVGNTFIYKYVDKDTTLVTRTVTGEKNFKDAFNLKLEMKNINRDIFGSWKFDFNVDSKDLIAAGNRIDVNKEYKIDDVTYNIKTIVLLPTELYVDLTAIASPDYETSEGDKIKALIITDENGVIIQGYSGLSGSNDKTKLEIKYNFYGFVEKMPKEFNFIPVKVNPLNDEYEVGTKISISNIPKITVKCDSNN